MLQKRTELPDMGRLFDPMQGRLATTHHVSSVNRICEQHNRFHGIRDVNKRKDVMIKSTQSESE